MVYEGSCTLFFLRTYESYVGSFVDVCSENSLLILDLFSYLRVSFATELTG